MRPALALIAERDARDFLRPTSKADADYAAWSTRILDETNRMPGSLGVLTATTTLLWLRYCGVGELWALSVCCKVLRGRELALGAASIVEVESAASCCQAYAVLRPHLPRGQAIPFGSALLPLAVGGRGRSRPSWLARLRVIRQGTMVLVRSQLTTGGRALRIHELTPDGRCVELSRRPLKDFYTTAVPSNFDRAESIGAVAYRGSLLVFKPTRFGPPTINDEAEGDIETSSFCNLTTSNVVRWDPSTALWHVVPFVKEGVDDVDDSDELRNALTQTNFRRTVCVDYNNRIVVASNFLLPEATPDLVMRFDFQDAWHVARCENFPAGREEDKNRACKWTALPRLRPWARSLEAVFVSVDATPTRPWLKPKREFNLVDVALFAEQLKIDTPSHRRRPEFRREGDDAANTFNSIDTGSNAAAVSEDVLGHVPELYNRHLQHTRQDTFVPVQNGRSAGGTTTLELDDNNNFTDDGGDTIVDNDDDFVDMFHMFNDEDSFRDFVPGDLMALDSIDGEGASDNDNDDEGVREFPTSPSAFRKYRRKAKSWLVRRHEASARNNKKEALLVAVTFDPRKPVATGDLHSHSNAAVYVFDEALWTWILVAVAPKSFPGAVLSACSHGNSVVLASCLDSAVALDLDSLTWDSVLPPTEKKIAYRSDLGQTTHIFRGQNEAPVKAISFRQDRWSIFDLEKKTDRLKFSHVASFTGRGFENGMPTFQSPAVLLPLPL